MALTVQVENEGGVREGEIWVHAESTRLFTMEHPGTSCLQFIDVYGDTVFNQLQIPMLLGELRALEQRLPEPALKLALRGLIHFVEAAADQVHTYVRFIGD